jgi:succinyl-CoA synthetase beta subunit
MVLKVEFIQLSGRLKSPIYTKLLVNFIVSYDLICSPQEVKEISEKMIGQHFITTDTNSNGLICNSVLISERKFPRRKFKFAITLDPQYNGPVVTASMDPNVNCKIPIKTDVGMTKQMANWIARKVGICNSHPSETENMLCNLYELFVCKNLLNVEINPWIEDVCLNYYATDVKIEVDDSSQGKNDEIFRKIDESQIDDREIAASKLGMKFVGYENGTIGCISNGAGLAMATNEIIKLYDGKPANFMDIGGSVTVDSMKKAVEIVLKDKNVTTLFVNIFGGLLSCNIVVEGLIKVMKENDSKIPCVVCFKGLKAKEAMQLIKKGDSSLIVRKDLDQATQMAIRCSKIMKTAKEGDLNAFLKMKMICDCDPKPQEKS